MEFRLFLWELGILGFIFLYPLSRKIFDFSNSKLDFSYFRSLLIFGSLTAAIQYGYYQEYIQNSEFIFIQLIILVFFMSSGFNSAISLYQSEGMNISKFNYSVLSSLSKGLSGSEPELINSRYQFLINTPYRLSYQVQCQVNTENGYFTILPYTKNLRIYKIILFFSAYMSIQSLIQNDEFIPLPLFNYTISSIQLVLLSITAVLIITYYEIQVGKSFSNEFPTLYLSLLRNAALKKSRKSDSPSMDINIKDKAKSILERREINTIKSKSNELKSKLENVFGTDAKSDLDPETIQRIKLMESVKRILNSTPPWKTVKLKDIVELADGEETEVEMIISGLINMKEVSGIYDIWSKTYSGTNPSLWYVNKIMSDIAIDGSNPDNIRIYPDGGVEINLKTDKKSSEEN